jgi:hypothetical protein
LQSIADFVTALGTGVVCQNRHSAFDSRPFFAQARACTLGQKLVQIYGELDAFSRQPLVGDAMDQSKPLPADGKPW